MVDNIRHLFIIGNGFDIAHGYDTSYSNFRKFLISRFPGCDEYDGPVPTTTIMPDGGEQYDSNMVAGYISRILDECAGENWGNLESSLGTSVIEDIKAELYDITMDQSDNEIWQTIFVNEDMSKDMKQSVACLKDFFCEWIMKSYRRMKYGFSGFLLKDAIKRSADYKTDIAEVLSEGDGFLNFNYTLTLEKVYEIRKDLICHIHGIVGDDNKNIFFGHGEEIESENFYSETGSESNLKELKRILKKDTFEAYCKHSSFFDRIGDDLVDIHSFGFGFSDVDLYYVRRIAEKIKNKSVVWYINKYDDEMRNKKSYEGQQFKKQLDKIVKMGFEVEVDSRW